MAPALTGPLSPSQEEAYRIKCMELIARMKEVASENDQLRQRKQRLVRGIKKMRLERAFLLDAIKQRMPKDDVDADEDEDTEDSSDSPPTPQERPLRTKKSHRRIAASPTPATHTRPAASTEKETASASQSKPSGAGKDSSITLASGSGESGTVKPKPDPDAVPSSSPVRTTKEAKESKEAKAPDSEGFQAFASHLLNDVLPTDPHGEAEVKNDFNNDYDEYARKKWGELDDQGRTKWEREAETKGRKKGRTSKGGGGAGGGGGDIEMKDAEY